MRIWLLAVATIVIGIGIGIGSALIKYPSVDFSLEAVSQGTPVVVPPVDLSNPEPRAVVDQETHNFGVMDSVSIGHHDFVITNAGNAPLTLAEGASTCSCTIGSVGADEVPPGGSTTVNLEWRGKKNAGPFRHSATVLTNDPTRPRVTLTVQGRMTGWLRAVPRELAFPSVSAGNSVTGTVRLFSYLDDTFKIPAVEWSDHGHFEVATRPIEPDQLADEPDVKSGYLVEVTVKPGLPLGGFRETITLQTNIEKVGAFEIPVMGTIGSEISIVGPGWDPETNIASLGLIEPDQGIERKLMIKVGGPNPKEITFQPPQWVPDLLDVELGDTTELGGGRFAMTPLFIRVHKGSHPAMYLGPERPNLGRITIETNHPQAPQLEIYVRFAVGT
jgi:hypothetical protein